MGSSCFPVSTVWDKEVPVLYLELFDVERLKFCYIIYTRLEFLVHKEVGWASVFCFRLKGPKSCYGL